MRMLAPRRTDITLTLMWIATSLVVVSGILKFDVGPCHLFIVPWCVVLFYRHPLLLVLLWPAVLFVMLAIPEYYLHASGFILTPMDPVYFFTAIHLMIHAITRGKEF